MFFLILIQVITTITSEINKLNQLSKANELTRINENLDGYFGESDNENTQVAQTSMQQIFREVNF